MAGALRCSTCGISWPPFNQWTKCGKCGEKTDPLANDTPDYDNVSDAVIAMRHFEFEREYEKRENGEKSKCGTKRAPTLQEIQRLNDLEANCRLLNEVERIYRFTVKGETNEGVSERPHERGTKV